MLPGQGCKVPACTVGMLWCQCNSDLARGTGASKDILPAAGKLLLHPSIPCDLFPSRPGLLRDTEHKRQAHALLPNAVLTVLGFPNYNQCCAWPQLSLLAGTVLPGEGLHAGLEPGLALVGEQLPWEAAASSL